MVVGASGYVGRNLTPAIAAAGYRVLGTGLRNLDSIPRGRRIKTRELDVRDRSAVQALVEEVRPEILVDCTTVSDPAQLAAVIVDGSRNLATASASVGAIHILLSTDNVFDGASGWYAEEDPVCPANPYGRAKAAAEEIVMRLSTRPVIVRTSLVSGLDPLDPRSQWVANALHQGTPVSLFTDELRCPIWIDDLVASVVELLDGRHLGVLHVVGPERLSRYEIGALIAEWLDLPKEALVPSLASRSSMARTLDGSMATGRARSVLTTDPRGFESRILALIEERGGEEEESE